ncbi:hypothetical protein HK097_008080 [Rhizophlyctis rosea]|uniref:Ubiquitin-like protease family profile domain-containing protein n=1 Tax=Rhizophlyctis rosea TaxID=64517 RepID=A0AAD5SIK2_9FUNG|nr:hypothetical protein HK097_008080 [Rhizophlyctis rosea]
MGDELPQQKDKFDCGVFVALHMEQLARGLRIAELKEKEGDYNLNGGQGKMGILRRTLKHMLILDGFPNEWNGASSFEDPKY